MVDIDEASNLEEKNSPCLIIIIFLKQLIPFGQFIINNQIFYIIFTQKKMFFSQNGVVHIIYVVNKVSITFL